MIKQFYKRLSKVYLKDVVYIFSSEELLDMLTSIIHHDDYFEVSTTNRLLGTSVLKFKNNPYCFATTNIMFFRFILNKNQILEDFSSFSSNNNNRFITKVKMYIILSFLHKRYGKRLGLCGAKEWLEMFNGKNFNIHEDKTIEELIDGYLLSVV